MNGTYIIDFASAATNGHFGQTELALALPGWASKGDTIVLVGPRGVEIDRMEIADVEGDRIAFASDGWTAIDTPKNEAQVVEAWREYAGL